MGWAATSATAGWTAWSSAVCPAAALRLRHGRGEHLPAQGPPGAQPARPGHGRQHVPDGDEPARRRSRPHWTPSSAGATYDIDGAVRTAAAHRRGVQLAESQDGVAKAAMWFSQPVTILLTARRPRRPGFGTEIVGVPLEDPMYMPPMVAGRWLQEGDQQALSSARRRPTTTTSPLGDTITLDLGHPARANGRWSGCTR